MATKGATRGRNRKAAGGGREKDWLIMLYLSGDNNLSPEMVRAMNEVEAAGLPDGFAVTIQYDPLAPGVETLRYAIPHQGPPVETDPAIPLRKYLIKKIHVENSADPETLREFIEASVKRFRSKHRMLVLSGHGSGAVGDFLPDKNARLSRPGSFTIPQVALALRNVRKAVANRVAHGRKLIDVLGLDSCLMSMAEVSYEVRADVQYLVGSEGLVQSAGWPYRYLLGKLTANPGGPLGPEPLVRRLVDHFIEYYEQLVPAGVSVDVAGCELARLKPLTDELQKLSGQLRKALDDPRIQNMLVVAHWRAQSYNFEQYTDLWDFCSELEKLATRGESAKKIAGICQRVMDLTHAVVGKGKEDDPGRQGCAGAEFQHSHGLSVYFPWSSSASTAASFKAYQKLSFAKATGWDQFLREYVDKTRRPPRDEERDGRRAGKKAPFRQYPRVAPRTVPGFRRVEGYNRVAEDYERLLTAIYGGQLPWSMKNPPQEVRVRSH
jgi:hypothetical protein